MKNPTPAQILALSAAAFVLSFSITSAQMGGGGGVWQQLFGGSNQSQSAAVYSTGATKATTATKSTTAVEGVEAETAVPRGPILTTDNQAERSFSNRCGRTPMPVGLVNQTVRCAQTATGFEWVAAPNVLNYGDRVFIGNFSNTGAPPAHQLMVVGNEDSASAISGSNISPFGNGIYGQGSASGVRGYATGSSDIGNEYSPIGVHGIVPFLDNGIGVKGEAHTGVQAIAVGTGGVALETRGPVLIVDGTQGAGKVLTSDSRGLASWQMPTGGPGGGLSGYEIVEHRLTTPVNSSAVMCPTGKVVLGGGCLAQFSDVPINDSYPYLNSWQCVFDTPTSFVAYAICAFAN